MWQTLKTKADFIRQVMTGRTTVRTAEDLDTGALTWAEVMAIASGNPAVMEKVRVDTEIRRLDQLRSAHLNQQHNIRWALCQIPSDIAMTEQTIQDLRLDIETCNAGSSEEFTMSVGSHTFSGKGNYR
jgi:hypothetical protein